PPGASGDIKVIGRLGKSAGAFACARAYLQAIKAAAASVSAPQRLENERTIIELFGNSASRYRRMYHRMQYALRRGFARSLLGAPPLGYYMLLARARSSAG